MALPSSRWLTRPSSSRTVRVPDVTGSPSTTHRSDGPMVGDELDVARGAGAPPLRRDQQLDRALGEAVQAVQGGG